MTLSSSDLALLRDEIGTVTPPTDDDLSDLYDELGDSSWVPTALRVLRRRRAAMATSEVKSVSLAGVVSVSLGSSLAALDRQIERLEAQQTQAQTVPADTSGVGYLHRVTAR